MNMVKNKYRSTLTNEHLHQCLRLAFTPFMAKFKPQKSVTFHTNKATSPFVHSSNVFVGVMFLDFDRPDPGLNGNLASGPFGFLIEYPCSKPIGHPTRSSRVSADGLLRNNKYLCNLSFSILCIYKFISPKSWF